MEYSIEKKSASSGSLLKFEGALTIYVITDLKSELLKELNSAEGSLTIDFAGLEEIDTAGIQLLILLKEQARQIGVELVYSSHSPALLRVMDLYGLVGYFADFIRLNKKERAGYRFKYGVKKITNPA